MAKKVDIDGRTYVLSRVRSTKEWFVFRDGGGGEVGRFDDAGNVVAVDQRGDWRATQALVERIRDVVLKRKHA